MILFLKSNYEVIVAVLALIVSCVAIWQTYRSLRMQRIHNSKSMLPIPNFNRLNYEDSIGVELENRGAGPLIIVSLDVVDRTDTNRAERP